MRANAGNAAGWCNSMGKTGLTVLIIRLYIRSSQWMLEILQMNENEGPQSMYC